MDSIRLEASTGNAQVDQILSGIVGIYETVFPGRVRGYYLAGSYADGSAVPAGSDIDLYLLFKEPLTQEEEEKARRIRRHCERICPVELELPVRSEAHLRENAPGIKCASRLIYGEDIRDAIPLPDFDTYLRQVTQAPLLHSARLRNRGPERSPLRFPLDAPDPSDEFCGYVETKKDPDGREWRSTKPLVHTVGWAATGTIGLEARQEVRDAAKQALSLA